MEKTYIALKDIELNKEYEKASASDSVSDKHIRCNRL